MFNNTQKSSPKAKAVAKSGLVPAVLHAINPSPALYEKITKRKLGYETDYSPKEGKTPFRLLISVGEEFIFLDMWNLQDRVNKSATGKTQYIDSSNGKTTWRATMAEAITELGEGCSECRVGEETVVNLMLQYGGAILNHLIDHKDQFAKEIFEGNWDMFNNLMQLHQVKKNFYAFVYSKTSDSGFVNLQAMRNIFTPAWKIVNKDGEIPTWTDKDGNVVSNVSKILDSVKESVAKSEFLQRPNVFISVQFGMVEEGAAVEVVSNDEIDEELPF